jgi:phytoene synthase
MVTDSQPGTEVVAGIVRKDGRMLICRRPEGAHLAGMWEFPGGKIEAGESPEEALAREIREELGIGIEVGSLRWKTNYTYPDRTVSLRFYDCRWRAGDAENDGVAAHEWVLPGELDRFDFLPADAPLVDILKKDGPPPTGGGLDEAYRECARMVAAHYENFPVASRMLPAPMRRHVAAVYAFARCADDFSDEAGPGTAGSGTAGSGTAGERLAKLDEWEARLEAAAEGRGEGPVFIALADTLRSRELPLQPFRDLLSAFRQDVTVNRYPDFSSLMDCCRLSANPVGRIVLMLHGVRDEDSFRRSDAICTALQLANHWQDVKQDYLRGRVYLPQADLEDFGVPESELGGECAGAALRALMVFQIRRARGLFAEGFPLIRSSKGALGRELRAIFRGGLAALESIERAEYDILKGSPRLGPQEKAACALAAFLPAGGLENLVGPGVDSAADANYCRWYVRSSRSSFYPAFRTLPPGRLRGLLAIYSFCRSVDDVADTPGNLGEKRRLLQGWKSAVGRLEEVSHDHPILRELAAAAATYGAPAESLREVIDGVEMDLKPGRYETFEELSVYCHKVASAVGMSCMGVFGVAPPAGEPYARSLGMALQLTNILRDLWADAREGRIYLPLEDLRRFGVAEEDIVQGVWSEPLADLLLFEAGRARAFFREAEDVRPAGTRRSLFAARLMGRIYLRMLTQMEKAGFPVSGWRPSLSKGAKIREALLCFFGP